MMRNHHSILYGLLALVLLSGGCAKSWSGKAADFQFVTHAGENMQIEKLAAGKPLILNYWADW